MYTTKGRLLFLDITKFNSVPQHPKTNTSTVQIKGAVRNGSLGIHFTRRGFAVELSVEKKSDGNEEKSPPTFFPFYLLLPLVNDGGKRQSSTFGPPSPPLLGRNSICQGGDQTERETGERGAEERIVFGNGRGSRRPRPRPASALPLL